MPKRQQYESDDGVNEDVPQGKKRKSVGNEMKKQAGKATVSTEMHKDDDGNEYWEISGKGRRVQVSSFKGTLMVGIREFYEKDGKMLPGKKGIALTTDQFASVLEVLPQIEAVLQSRGVDMPRPAYDDPLGPTDGEEEEEEGPVAREETQKRESLEEVARENGEGTNEQTQPSGKLDKPRRRKANHEATDDEDE